MELIGARIAKPASSFITMMGNVTLTIGLQ
jgi:hypothetical protein